MNSWYKRRICNDVHILQNKLLNLIYTIQYTYYIAHICLTKKKTEREHILTLPDVFTKHENILGKSSEAGIN